MNFLQLEYFQEVARHQSITKAAQVLGISQSALSIMMNKLEAELGYPLFEKQGRNITVTPYGKQVLYYSYIILQEKDDIEKEFRELKGEENEARLTLGMTDSNYYGDWMIDLMEKYPELKINVMQMSRNEIYEQLLTGKLDFGISSGISYHSALCTHLLFSQPYQLLVPAKHPLAGRGMITMEELAREPLLSLPPSHKDRMIDNLAREMHFKPNTVFEGDSNIMLDMLRAGVGSVLTCSHNRRQWIDFSPGEYVTLDIVGVTTRYEMYLCWSKRRYLSKWAEIFQRYVLDYYHV